MAQPHGALAANAGGGAAGGLTIGDVLRVLRANLLLIIICTILGAVIGFVVNNYVFDKYYKEYTARAVLKVQTPTTYDPYGNSAGLGGIAQSPLEVQQKTLAQELLGAELWRPLLMNASSQVRRTDFVQSFVQPGGGLDLAKALESLQKNLGVVPNASTQLISVTMSAPTPDDSKVLLEGIVNQLISTETSAYQSGQQAERQTYQQLQSRLQVQIDNLTQQINDLSGRLNMARDKSGQGNGTAVLLQIQLQALEGVRIKKESDRNEAMSEFQSYATAYDSGNVPALLQQILDQNPRINRADAMVDDAASNLAAVKAMNGSDSRQVRAAQAQYDAYKQASDSIRESSRVSMGAGMRDRLESSAKAAQTDLDATDQQIADAERRMGELNKETANYNTALDLREYLTAKKNKIDENLSVLDAASLRTADTRGSVRLWSSIDKPEAASFPNLKLTVGVASLLGLGLALGIAFLRELMDTTVRSPRDITKVGQLNLLGMIPHTDDDPQAAAGELSLAISQSPNSIIAENFRQVRTRLQHAASLDTTRSLLVTSPGPGDGKTVVACNIAAGLALNGRKILLVDANFRRPALHSVFGLTNDNGFGSVLSGAAQVEQVAKHTQVPNLDVLTTGPRPANPTELLESQLLTDFIDHALEEYDHVIFDAGPILLVSETVALAPRVDGVVTVVRAKANSRGLLQRMRDALRQLKAEHLGVVLNGVRQHTGGYYRRNIKNYYAYQNGTGN